jgi:hypothetical protein
MAVIFLLAMIAGKLRIPRWSFAALGVLVMMIAFCWMKASGSHVVGQVAIVTLILTPFLVAGTVIGWIGARRGSRLQGDIAMAIFVGFIPFQCLEAPRTASQAPIPHIAIKLDAKLLDACVGQYKFPSDNVFFIEWKLTIRQQGDQLVGQESTVNNKIFATFEIYPESETNFFFKTKSPQELAFIKNDKGEVTAVIFHRGQGLPESEGKKLKDE